MGKSRYLTRLVIYWANGDKAGRFPSNDKPRDLANNQHIPGMNRLRKLLTTKYAGKYNTALIYHNETDQLLEKWIDDQKVA